MPSMEKRQKFGMLRRRRLLTVRKLAAMTGLSTRTILDLEHGRTVPQLGTIRKLSEALEVDPLEVVEFAQVIEGSATGKAAA